MDFVMNRGETSSRVKPKSESESESESHSSG
jgi:hypothetical protein